MVVRITLYTVAAFLFIAPVLFWLYVSGLACGYRTDGKCPISFLDSEFAMLAAIPWMLAALLAFLAWHRS